MPQITNQQPTQGILPTAQNNILNSLQELLENEIPDCRIMLTKQPHAPLKPMIETTQYNRQKIHEAKSPTILEIGASLSSPVPFHDVIEALYQKCEVAYLFSKKNTIYLSWNNNDPNRYYYQALGCDLKNNGKINITSTVIPDIRVSKLKIPTNEQTGKINIPLLKSRLKNIKNVAYLLCKKDYSKLEAQLS